MSKNNEKEIAKKILIVGIIGFIIGSISHVFIPYSGSDIFLPKEAYLVMLISRIPIIGNIFLYIVFGTIMSISNFFLSGISVIPLILFNGIVFFFISLVLIGSYYLIKRQKC